MYPHIPHLRRGCLNSLPEKSAKLSNYVLEIGTSIFLFVIKNRGFFLANIKIPTWYTINLGTLFLGFKNHWKNVQNTWHTQYLSTLVSRIIVQQTLLSFRNFPTCTPLLQPALLLNFKILEQKP